MKQRSDKQGIPPAIAQITRIALAEIFCFSLAHLASYNFFSRSYSGLLPCGKMFVQSNLASLPCEDVARKEVFLQHLQKSKASSRRDSALISNPQHHSGSHLPCILSFNPFNASYASGVMNV
jgi:hypothetical protein